jgi:hypothetical protein
MKAEDTSVGSMLAAMIYQIEEQNKNGEQDKNVVSSKGSVSHLFAELDDLFNKVSFENAAISTDFKHQFSSNKITPPESLPNKFSSPYQTLINKSDDIAIRSGSFKFLNGKDQG